MKKYATVKYEAMKCWKCTKVYLCPPIYAIQISHALEIAIALMYAPKLCTTKINSSYSEANFLLKLTQNFRHAWQRNK